MNETMRGIFEIAALFIGVAVLTLIIGRSQDSARVIGAAGDTFGNLLQIVTLQSSALGGYSGRW